MSLYLKGMIGKLSAYCGAVSAGSAAGAGIAYLKGASAAQISHALQIPLRQSRECSATEQNRAAAGKNRLFCLFGNLSAENGVERK